MICLQQMKVLLELISSASQTNYWLSAPDFSEVLFVDEEYESIWGHSRQKLYDNPLIWLESIETTESDLLEKIKKNIHENQELAKINEKYCIRSDNGTSYWVHDIGFPIYQNGEIIGILRQFKNITHQHTTHNEVKKLIQQADITKERFLSNIGHMFRTPLSRIIGFADQIFNQTANPPLQEYSMQIRQSCEMVLKSFNEILEASKSSESLDIKVECFLWNNIISELKLKFSNTIEKKDIHFRICHDKKNDPSAISQPYLIRKILEKLLHNAIKNTENGTITLSIEFSKLDNHWIINVSDTGKGISPEYQVLIFELFESIKPSYQDSKTGLGLGLFIVRKYIEKLHGTIKLTSQINQGTTFTIRIPNSELETSTITHKQDSDRTISSVLLIEDDLITTKILNISLKRLNCDVTICHNGNDGLTALKNKSYDLILTDIGLPDIGGPELCTKLMKHKTQNTRIIATSAHLSEQIKKTLSNIGVHETIEKPLTQDIIKRVINYQVENRI